ncbi:RimK family alpha-L-glutamate ligase [Streptomyces sp. NPDC056222]|uniref:ATP-grasp domain-containing protein n=1 Tax=Streptomyces sp. NPDC056222 TaxID=3345749 RepID=UPI0035DF229F
MGTARIAIVTSEAYADLDEDLPLIVEALRADGFAAEAVAWDADSADWGGYDLAVIRSTWDYADRLDEFLAWAEDAGRATRLKNASQIVHWSSDKRYLAALAERGVSVVPTRFIEPGEQVRPEYFDGPEGVVVKPTVSLGARDTARYEPGRHADAAGHARMLLEQGRAVMVQPYLPLVAEGERALVFFSGVFSHAIRKGQVLTEPNVIDNARTPHPDVAPYQPTETELRTALEALAAVPGTETPLIARVDLALDSSRVPVVMELELIEPHLFLGANPEGLKRFVEAVAAESRR